MPRKAPPPQGDLEEWEIDTARVAVAVFLRQQEVFSRADTEDLVQECLVHWLSIRRTYRQDRGASAKTYMRAVLRNKLADLLDAETALKRGGSVPLLSLSQPVLADDEESWSLAESLADLSEEADTELMAQRRLLHDRLQLLRADLPPDQQALFDALFQEGTMAAASRLLGRSRSRLHSRLAEIADAARKRGLEDFLR